MATTTRTVIINAAFLRELKEDNHELWHLLHETWWSCQSSWLLHLSGKRTFALISQLRDRLVMHFSLEETYGYFEDAAVAAPNLSQQAEMLRDEHQALLAQISAIVEAAEHLAKGDGHAPNRRLLAGQFSSFYYALQQHEAGETELIIEVLEQGPAADR